MGGNQTRQHPQAACRLRKEEQDIREGCRNCCQELPEAPEGGNTKSEGCPYTEASHEVHQLCPSAEAIREGVGRGGKLCRLRQVGSSELLCWLVPQENRQVRSQPAVSKSGSTRVAVSVCF